MLGGGGQSLDGGEDDIDVEGDDGGASPRLQTDAEVLHAQAAAAQQQQHQQQQQQRAPELVRPDMQE